MSQTLHELAARVAQHLTSHVQHAGSALSCELRYVGSMDLKALSIARAVVVPRSQARSSLGRGQDQLDIEIDIALMKRCPPDDLTAVSELVATCGRIDAALNRSKLELTDGWASWKSSRREPLYLEDALQDQRVFIGVVGVTFVAQEVKA